jgi:branched-chain amino acid aminotransferase
LSEAPGENIFVVRNNTLITPPLESSALEGITRDSVMEIAKDLGYSVKEKTITRSEAYLADEMFLTGTAAEITPVISIDGRKIGNGKPGNITKQIVSTYSDIVKAKNDKYSSWLSPVY